MHDSLKSENVRISAGAGSPYVYVYEGGEAAGSMVYGAVMLHGTELGSTMKYMLTVCAVLRAISSSLSVCNPAL